jgi:hypothetical protein
MTKGIVGRTYLEKGRLVLVLAKWRHVPMPKGVKGPPRNVLVGREDGSRVVRPFRGL